jgi:hypothetical protein
MVSPELPQLHNNNNNNNNNGGLSIEDEPNNIEVEHVNKKLKVTN